MHACMYARKLALHLRMRLVFETAAFGHYRVLVHLILRRELISPNKKRSVCLGRHEGSLGGWIARRVDQNKRMQLTLAPRWPCHAIDHVACGLDPASLHPDPSISSVHIRSLAVCVAAAGGLPQRCRSEADDKPTD
ncbi:unnamed protein product [Periconia digitata]|uniref:Uncharacterized protein n=1 Tax=Periconia digitata TaxID=1303443 RepID=A0A9W4U3F2_9PLEO|nr:unnamed protein product [Periconia digitata]